MGSFSIGSTSRRCDGVAEGCGEGLACGDGDCAGVVVGKGCGCCGLCAKPKEINNARIAMSDLKMGFLMERDYTDSFFILTINTFHHRYGY